MEHLASPGVARYYLTTPIYYVNDAPHVGHAYTTLDRRRRGPLASPQRRRGAASSPAPTSTASRSSRPPRPTA